MLLLALFLAGNVAPSCRTIPSGIQCELTPPVPHPMPVAVSTTVRPKPAGIAQVHDKRAPRRPLKSAAVLSPRPASAVDDATAQLHVASLVSIGDCTGARTYARLIGKTALAHKAYSSCVGGPTMAPEDVASAR
jgi:hypothetical protein